MARFAITLLLTLLGASILLPGTPAEAAQTGAASFYSIPQLTASGESFNPGAMTAAHRSLPFGTRVRVTSLASGRSVIVRINDRGPFTGGRIIDLSSAAAGALGMRHSGVARVRIEVIGRGTTQVARAAKRSKGTVEVASRTKRHKAGVTVASSKKRGGTAKVAFTSKTGKARKKPAEIVVAANDRGTVEVH